MLGRARRGSNRISPQKKVIQSQKKKQSTIGSDHNESRETINTSAYRIMKTCVFPNTFLFCNIFPDKHRF